MGSLDDINTLVKRLNPRSTVLFLGSGASVTSGGPTAVDLCRFLEQRLAAGEEISNDLAEVSSILEARTSRMDLVQALSARLANLAPDAGLSALMTFPWAAIYTTNYDLLIEKALERSGRSYAVVRSNYDWDRAHDPSRVVVYKIHGCLTQDRGFGHAASMIVTYEDYDSFDRYRQLLFGRLRQDLAGGHLLFIGYSLQDADLKDALRYAVDLQKEAGAPGRTHVLMYRIDAERADLWRRRGISTMAAGDVNSFAGAMHEHHAGVTTTTVLLGPDLGMPSALAASTILVREAIGAANPRWVYHGAAATYADVREGATFPRDVEDELVRSTKLAMIVLGTAGTGKTTLARRILIAMEGAAVTPLLFEHRYQMPLKAEEWVSFEKTLHEAGLTGVLLIDGCTSHQRQLNVLIRHLPNEGSALRLLLTAETSVWKLRQKDPRLFSHATTRQLSALSSNEIRRLLDMLNRRSDLKTLVESSFLQLSRVEQIRLLESRCRADMFVCLKALFSSDTLDDILLREFASIESPYQEIYRITCALEAAGAIPHRQMVLRLANFEPHLIAGALQVLDGLVTETPESEQHGIFLWHTRHELIANIISQYKFADSAELYDLLSRAIESANPSYYVEARSLREMCNAERGIRGVATLPERISLFRAIVRAMPTDRVARHRLVRELIHDERLGDADAELRAAIEDVGLDPPLHRYRIRLAIRRSRGSDLMIEDRRAILLRALADAEKGVDRFPDNKYMYFAAGEAAKEWFYLTRERGRLDWARELLTEAYERLLDPEVREKLQELSAL